ncbi:hypothetical protein ACFL34_04895 [Candidatus Sumerlaeota bacterium]
MPKPIPIKSVHYCYHCGNRLGIDDQNCWYCGVPIHRQIQELQQCPFCAESIRLEAVKCRYCGEFLDGKPQVIEKPAQYMIVVDKSLLNSKNDMRLLPGMPVPDVAKGSLNEKTVRAIEQDHLEKIEETGVLVLPAPEAAKILVGAKPFNSGEVVDVQPKKEKVATAQPPSAEPQKITGVKAAHSYCTCPNCKAEILTIDNFCYHCGSQHHPTKESEYRKKMESQRKRRQRVKRIVAWAIIVIVVAVIAYLYFGGTLSREKVVETERQVRSAVKEKVVKPVEKLEEKVRETTRLKIDRRTEEIENE